MKTKFIFSLTILTGLILGSCASSNQVGGGGIFQKRKYNKGFYWNRGSNLKSSNETASNEILSEEDADLAKSYEIKEHAQENELISASMDEAMTSEFENTPSFSKSEKENVNPVNVETHKTQVEVKKPKTHFNDNETRMVAKKKHSAPAPAANVPFIVLIILAILLPPLAVFLYEGASTRFWFDLIFFLIGGGVGFLLFGALGGLFALLAIVYALLIVCEVI